MTVSSRTPEGEPQRCAICDQVAAVELSYPFDDACCPSCGSLVVRMRDRVADALQIETASLTLEAKFDEVGADSLDMVELVMALEEEFGIDIPDDATERINTLGDAIRYIEKARRRSE